jgi:hypothetical protein
VGEKSITIIARICACGELGSFRESQDVFEIPSHQTECVFVGVGPDLKTVFSGAVNNVCHFTLHRISEKKK